MAPVSVLTGRYVNSLFSDEWMNILPTTHMQPCSRASVEASTKAPAQSEQWGSSQNHAQPNY